MQSNRQKILRIIVLIAGALVFVLPRFIPESEPLYSLAPWLFTGCFLFYSRSCTNWKQRAFFTLVLLSAHEIRYTDFLGDSYIEYTLIAILLDIVLTLAAIIPFYVDEYLNKNGNLFFGLIAYPVMRIAVEHFISGRQFNLSLTQFGNKWLIQSTALVGDAFITFMVTFVPSVIVMMILKKGERRVLLTGIVSLLLCALVFVLGGIRYSKPLSLLDPIHMAYASGPQKVYYEEPSEEDASYSENEIYLTRTAKEAADNGAELIAYAEEAFIVTYEEEKQLVETAEKAAQDNDIFILLCLDSEDEDGVWVNKAVLIDNEGSILSDYLKTNMIPVIEDDYKAGDGIIPCNHVTIGGQERYISYSICFDATFPTYIMTMDDKTDLFINPSWDWDEIDDLNYRLQAISALESGVVLFKPTVDGVSIVTDPYGNLSYKENTLGGDYEEVRYVDVPAGRTDTIYSSIYKYIAPVWSFLALLILVYAAVCRLKR